MKIALILENSQADKNPIIFRELKNAAEPCGHTVYNYGMYSSKDKRYMTYVMNGLLASILLCTKAADFVVTGCGTGEGACLACNAYPGVQCGHIATPIDSYLFTQINAGNAISIPYALGYGWGGELNLRHIFQQLFITEFGGGYPPERADVERKNKGILDKVKSLSHRPLLELLKVLDRDFVKTTIDDPQFADLFYPNCQDQAIADFLKSL